MQFYLFCTFGITEVILPAVMAYDCFVAICDPLLYMVTMSRNLCVELVSCCYFNGTVCSVIHLCFALQILLGASVRNSAHGKGHEEGGSAYAKEGSSLRSPPGNSQASTPKTRVCLLYCFVLSPTPLTLWGAVPHHLSQRRSNLELQLIIIPGCDRSVSTHKLF